MPDYAATFQAWLLCIVAGSLLQVGVALAQVPEPLPFRTSSVTRAADSALLAEMPASHRSADQKVDQPVRVLYCPNPAYPPALAEYGYDGYVIVRFVVDTLGLAELDDLVVSEASHPGFVEPVRRAISKCRYQPAWKAGRRVRLYVQQRVTYHLRDSTATR